MKSGVRGRVEMPGVAPAAGSSNRLRALEQCLGTGLRAESSSVGCDGSMTARVNWDMASGWIVAKKVAQQSVDFVARSAK